MARMKQRGRTAVEWSVLNEVLLAREMGIETDTRKFKFGDGVTPWNSLDYANALSEELADVALSGAYADLSGTPTLGSAAAENSSAFTPAAHLTDLTSAHTSEAIAVVDTAALFTATDVEGVLEEEGTARVNLENDFNASPELDGVSLVESPAGFAARGVTVDATDTPILTGSTSESAAMHTVDVGSFGANDVLEFVWWAVLQQNTGANRNLTLRLKRSATIGTIVVDLPASATNYILRFQAALRGDGANNAAEMSANLTGVAAAPVHGSAQIGGGSGTVFTLTVQQAHASMLLLPGTLRVKRSRAA